MVQSATPANVDTVLVDGRIVKRGGRLVAYDVDKIVRDAKASALRIRTAAGGRLCAVRNASARSAVAGNAAAALHCRSAACTCARHSVWTGASKADASLST